MMRTGDARSVAPDVGLFEGAVATGGSDRRVEEEVLELPPAG